MLSRIVKYWKSSSKAEHTLICITTVAVFLVVILSIILVTRNTTEISAVSIENFCSTPTCIIEAAGIVQRIDPNVDPCDDFYKFACGTYLKNAHDDPTLDAEQLQEAARERQLTELYAEPIRQDDHYMVRAEKKLLKACMNTTVLTNEHKEILREVFKAVGGWPILEGSKWDESKFDWLQATYKLRELGYPFDTYLNLWWGQNWTNHTRSMLEVSLGKGHNPGSAENRKGIMANYTRIFDANPELALTEIEEMYKLEDRLENMPNLYQVQEFQKIYDFVNWIEFINNIAGPSAQMSLTDIVKFPELSQLRRSLDVIDSTSKRIQANYLIFTMLEKIMPYFTQQYVSIKEHLEYCIVEIRESFVPSPLDITYARRYLPKSKKERIVDLGYNIINTYATIIRDVQWLMPEDKQYMQERVKKLVLRVGRKEEYYSDEVLDELNVDMIHVTNDNFLNLLAQATRNHKSHTYGNVKKSYKEVSSDIDLEWILMGIYRSSLYAITDVQKLEVMFLQNSIFDENRPNYLNYGVLGTFIAKPFTMLITKNFDEGEQGIYDMKGWSLAAAEKFKKFEQCINTSMTTSFEMPKNIKQTELERSILGGKVAYEAYKHWVKQNAEEQKLMAIDYTPNQLFWISSVTCRPGNVSNIIAGIQNSDNTESYVTNQVMRNNPDFSKDFNCNVGSRLNPAEKCIKF